MLAAMSVDHSDLELVVRRTLFGDMPRSVIDGRVALRGGRGYI
jgi:hypothetical protein